MMKNVFSNKKEDYIMSIMSQYIALRLLDNNCIGRGLYKSLLYCLKYYPDAKREENIIAHLKHLKPEEFILFKNYMKIKDIDSKLTRAVSRIRFEVMRRNYGSISLSKLKI
jgi:predicted metal-dependent hydrolase